MSYVMIGEGLYNKYSRITKDMSNECIELLKISAESINIDDKSSITFIADYGCAQGKNSLEPLSVILPILNRRYDNKKEIAVIHIDKENNDFSDLFKTINNSDDSYQKITINNIFSLATGSSYFNQVVPKNSISLGFSFLSIHWLSKVPKKEWNNILFKGSNNDAIEEVRSIAAEDWRTFLDKRNEELKTGGKLVMSILGQDDNGNLGFEDLFGNADTVLKNMVKTNLISFTEFKNMKACFYTRSKLDILQPFEQYGCLKYKDLVLKHISYKIVKDYIWLEFKKDNDIEKLANYYSMFYYSILSDCLFSNTNRPEKIDLIDIFTKELKLEIMKNPFPLTTTMFYIVIEKS